MNNGSIYVEENFSAVYDDMTEEYNDIEQMMSRKYEQLRMDPNNESLKFDIMELGSFAHKKLSHQGEFAQAYAPKDLKEQLLHQLIEKDAVLLDELGKMNQPEHTEGKKF